MNSILNKLMFSPTFKIIRVPYDKAKYVFEKVDIQMGYVIDRFRRSKVKKDKQTQAEREVVEQIHAFDDFSTTLSLKDDEKQQLMDKQGQLKWTLKQMRGTQE